MTKQRARELLVKCAAAYLTGAAMMAILLTAIMHGHPL
jgi:hypothetical protein